VPQAVWDVLFPPNRDRRPAFPGAWHESATELYTDTWVAEQYGRFPWEYYAETSPQERHLMRAYFAVKHAREAIKHAQAQQRIEAEAERRRQRG
jgi:hypothetical protein